MDYLNYTEDELLNEFWLEITQDKYEESNEKKVNIYAWDMHPESIQLGLLLNKKLNSIIEVFRCKVNVILSNYKIPQFYELNEEQLVEIQNCDFVYSSRNYISNTFFNWDLKWFSKLVLDKKATTKILNTEWLQTPNEILVNSNMWLSKIKDIILSFFNNLNHEDKIVVKPNNEDRWEWISIIDNSFNFTELYLKYIKNKWDILFQRKIHSYPIYVDNERKDWNIRVLVSYDISSNSYKSMWIIGRIWKYNNVINVSKWGGFISWEKIKTFLPNDFDENLLHSISEKAITLLSTSVSRLNESYDTQDLSWIDIIIDEDLWINILEVNDSLSGWILKLTEYLWNDSIDNYIACILRKVKLYIDHVE